MLTGSQYILSLTSDVDAKGNITVTLNGPDGHSNSQAFQTYNFILFFLLFKYYNVAVWKIFSAEDTLPAGSAQQRVTVTPWNMKSVNQVQLVYNKYTSLIHKDGVNQWTLVGSAVTDTNGNM